MTIIKLISGYVEMPVIRARGGRAATRASNIKSQSGDRLEAMVNGTAVGRGAENTDSMKEGNLTPEVRMSILRSRVDGFDARIAKMTTEIVVTAKEGATSLKLQQLNDALRALRARREETVGDLVSIVRGMTEGDDE